MYQNIKQAETQFLQRNFESTIQYSYKTLCNINNVQPKNLKENVLQSLSNFKKVKDEKLTQEDLEIESICLSLIFQSLYELKQIDDAKILFTTYYPKNKFIPPKLSILLIQMLIYLNEFEEAEKQMDDLKKQSVEMDQLVQTELKTILKKKQKFVKEEEKKKQKPNLTKVFNEFIGNVKETPKKLEMEKKSKILEILSTLKQFSKKFLRWETLIGVLILFAFLIILNLPQRAKQNLWKNLKDFIGMAFEI
eukprot:gene4682-8254_t